MISKNDMLMDDMISQSQSSNSSTSIIYININKY